ncbi:hypothetical protein PL2TA16_03568 [Pseudoalteromonas luteoviolacea 2ta16]|uniref:Uncharacterized protein n=1 Tax=Pseudoalteromonas luteoviolacea (strain 2ta16) TaxID=1353533 RepID=V4JCY5_PSEL2|nr:hypothetical protein PL2TA16_03568 [Pseudoalteromonas luteoviolacea 2ta16]
MNFNFENSLRNSELISGTEVQNVIYGERCEYGSFT